MLQDDSKVLLHKAHGPRWIVGRVKFTRENFSRLASRLGTQLGGNLTYGKCLERRETIKETNVIHGGQQKCNSRGAPNDFLDV